MQNTIAKESTKAKIGRLHVEFVEVLLVKRKNRSVFIYK